MKHKHKTRVAIYNHNNMEVDKESMCAIPRSLSIFDYDTFIELSNKYPCRGEYFITTVEDAISNNWIGTKRGKYMCTIVENGIILNSHVMVVRSILDLTSEGD